MVLNAYGPAPGRGHYDRSQNRSERHVSQRGRLSNAVCGVLAEEGPQGATVDRIIRRAKVGRSTFYAHFRDVSEAIEAATTSAASAVFETLDQTPVDARTPLERLRRFARTWFQVVTTGRAEVECALAVLPGTRSVLSAAGERLCERLKVLIGDAQKSAALGTPVETPRLIACASAIEGLTRAFLAARISRAEAEMALVDVCVRLFR
jgi:AcrR family transcriptional regulator